jgi:hypothetical protein
MEKDQCKSRTVITARLFFQFRNPVYRHLASETCVFAKQTDAHVNGGENRIVYDQGESIDLNFITIACFLV